MFLLSNLSFMFSPVGPAARLINCKHPAKGKEFNKERIQNVIEIYLVQGDRIEIDYISLYIFSYNVKI